MARPRLAWRVFALVAAASTVLVAVMALAGMATMRRLNEDAGSFTLSRGAAALAALAPTEESAARSFCASGGADSGLRLTIVGPDGRVWGDSRSDPATMENHLDRYEVREALRGNAASSTRVSGTLGLSMTYAAAPIQRDGTTVAALRVAMDTPELAGRVKPFVSSSLAAAALLLLFGAGAGAWIGKTLAKPLDALARTASRWSEGRLECRARGISDPDFSLLADTMNAMAEELSLRIKESERGKAELAAVLAALGEGVIAVDGTLTVRFSNPKARELLGAAAPLEGKGLLLATGNTELEALAADCAARKVPVSVELPVYGDETRVLGIHSQPFALDDGTTGAVMALGDLSAIKRLERVRKDFVANVSHELRTPVTLIKGFAETLEDGGASVEETARFVAIIRRHADRMASIIDDLLTLARLEAADRRRGAMDGLEPMLLAEVMAGAVDSASLTLEARKASVSVDCPPDIRILAHPGLFEQALVNLLDNAAKYGPEGGVVEMKAVVDRDERFVSVSVLDRGPGVPEKDRPRLFERFYRVDRARSRELGGTGLGLAIVRHIALAHGGDAALRAREGGGSEFILRVPRLVQREDSVQEGSPEGAPEGAPSGESPATSV